MHESRTDIFPLPDIVYLKAWVCACSMSNHRSANWLAGFVNERSRAVIRYEAALREGLA